VGDRSVARNTPRETPETTAGARRGALVLLLRQLVRIERRLDADELEHPRDGRGPVVAQ